MHTHIYTSDTIKSTHRGQTGMGRLGLPEEDGALLSEETVNNTGGKTLFFILF